MNQTQTQNASGQRAKPKQEPATVAEVDAGWELLVSNHYQLLREAAGRVVDASSVDDIIHDAYLAIRGAAPAVVRDQDEFRWYARQTVANVALRYAKREARRGGLEETNIFDTPTSFTVPGGKDGGELAFALRAAINKLPRAQREVCLLAATRDLSVREVAEELGSTRDIVTGLLRKAKTAIYREVQLTAVGKLCPEWAEDIRVYVLDRGERDLSRGGSVRAKQHLDACDTCRAAVDENYRLQAAATRLLMPPIVGLRYLLEAAGDSARAVVEFFQGVAHRLYTLIFGAGREISATVPGWSAPARACAGVACILVAGGAATVGIQRGRDAARHSTDAGSQSVKRPVAAVNQSLTTAPGALGAPVKSESKDRSSSKSDKALPKKDQRKAATQDFSPDNSGAPVAPSASAPKTGQSQGGPSSTSQSTKPPTGGSEEFQP